ncbi:Acetylornithine deacetylase/Succinyl-diaminopimelate desuccinylase [Amycolatopsis arida]|uniref:Acetylornithine deacetylase/Succinyl-diaminopimelate desuccinylase n=1 Tax=Amycolatopsis arida TaxID=587909 RepID=A0A1I5TG50_9PSEU|nr:M20/M25/M40 family metallo-hydrolase [Amycolatopsis arida]TDX96106.1 acetylornithine deacetylase/succinyl-diaminopimelate desuccinylase-like protein [Amycolatopsis arida]SFP82019.1 Acetylornithine deacetylase/Succinyl-diaminopimelate desuccinylase [Amycolatopsis arida]
MEQNVDQYLDQNVVHETVRGLWANDVLPSLSGLVEIPALSPVFDTEWQRSGHLDAAVEHVRRWLSARDIPGAEVDVVRLEGRSPVLLLDVPATPGAEDRGTVLLYGHLDKQPPVGGWSDGLGPWTPVLRGDRLYGRGSADDGYAGYAATAALEAVRAAGGGHARAVVLLETGEESGSPDLPAYLAHLGERLGPVSFVVCLDSGGNDYERLWLTTSLRGMAQVRVTVRVLESAQHSGLASGVVPDSFRILRSLLDRVEDPATGRILINECTVDIPENRRAEAAASAAAAPGALAGAFPRHGSTRPVNEDDVELLLNNSWRPTLSVIGAAGLPEPAHAGNVLRTSTTLALSFRLPPTADSAAALTAIEKALSSDVPYGATVELTGVEHANGWNAPDSAPWLSAALQRVSDQVFGAPSRSIGLGGSIPFMGLLAERYPAAQFLVTGALGPDSNAHVPDEWLHVPHAQRVTEAVAHILHAHARG